MQSSTPCSRIVRKSRCRSGASGVVRTLGSRTPAIVVSTVPMSPVVRPIPRSSASRMYAVVVFPFVPVRPYSRGWAGSVAKTCAEIAPSTARGSSTRTTVREPRSSAASRRRSRPRASVSTASTPRPSTSAAKLAPWTRAPGSAAHRSPAVAWRESCETPATARSASPRMRASAGRSRSESFIISIRSGCRRESRSTVAHAGGGARIRSRRRTRERRTGRRSSPCGGAAG